MSPVARESYYDARVGNALIAVEPPEQRSFCATVDLCASFFTRNLFHMHLTAECLLVLTRRAPPLIGDALYCSRCSWRELELYSSAQRRRFVTLKPQGAGHCRGRER